MDEVLSATQRRCPIELTVTPDLLHGDADNERLLGHIFTNLLSNAVLGNIPESGSGGAGSTSPGTKRNAVCVIHDQGIGISEGDQARLFTAFHRGENVSCGNRSGTGLGIGPGVKR